MSQQQWQPVPRKEPDREPRYGRPLVIPVDGGKPIPYTRATTWAGAIEDQNKLMEWKQRMVAAGIAQRPDLHLRAASLGLEPLDEDELKRWKKEMNQVAAAATEAAKASAAATIGTSVHEYTERMDRGMKLGYVPPEYRDHLKAYEEATKDFTAVHIERFCVLDDIKVGGTPDRILQVPGFDKLIIGDIKTGNVDYGIGKMAIQLALYAHAQIYDIDTGQRFSPGDVDLEKGMILALNAKTGKIDIFWIDIAAGWWAAQLAGQVRAWRSRAYPRNLTAPYQPVVQDTLPAGPPNLTVVPDPATDAAIVNAIRAAGSPDELIALWQAAGARWTARHTQLAAARKAQLAAA